MIYKEKLAGGGGNRLKPYTYTHLITTTATYYPIDTYDYNAKTITPNTLDGYIISSLTFSESSTTFIIALPEEASNISSVYLADYTSKKRIRLSYLSTNYGNRIYQSSYYNFEAEIKELFVNAVSTEQPITITSNTPPPWDEDEDKDDNDHSGGGDKIG